MTINKIKGAKGYQVQYAANSKFKKGVKSKTMGKASLTLGGMKKGKTYYVRVRAYKMDSENGKIYGKYGAAKKAKIKK